MSQVHLIKDGDKLLARVERRGADEFVVYVTDEPINGAALLQLFSGLAFTVYHPETAFDPR